MPVVDLHIQARGSSHLCRSPARFASCEAGSMTTQLFLELSTRLVKDVKDWSEEATRRNALTPEDLIALQRAAEIVDQATVAAVARSAE